METPSSMHRITRSQAGSVTQLKKHEEASTRSRKNGNQERAVLQDLTNDSPINGVAIEKTPLSSAIKYASLPKTTPGSGEALLRGQVKILLEKVEEGAELVNRFPKRLYSPFFPAAILPISPGLLAAPTPANTPQNIVNVVVKEEIGEAAAAASVIMQASLIGAPKDVGSVKFEESLEECVQNRAVLFDEFLVECELNRALQFDSPDKSEASDVTSYVSSSMTYQGSAICSSHGDNWSTQANVSAYTDDEEEDDSDNEDEVEHEHEQEEEEDDEEEEEEEDCYLDELCEGMRNITVEDNRESKLPEFKGKHTRFLYNSDGELEGEEESAAGKALSPSVLVLKGLPVPEGKHLRFHEEEEGDE